MKMQRFIATDARQAIREINKALGADALILSNRKVADGVEIIAAVDYEEDLGAVPKDSTPVIKAHDRKADGPSGDTPAPDDGNTADGGSLEAMRRELQTLRSMLAAPLPYRAWTEMERRHPRHAAVLRRLSAMGMHPVIANRVADQVTEIRDPQQAWAQALRLLRRMLASTEPEELESGGIMALLGPTGVGKTTTIAKLAARFALQHGRSHVALVSMDCFRVGAHDQLEAYGRLLDIPVHFAANRRELQKVLNRLRHHRLVLIDTAGTRQRDMRMAEQFAALDAADDGIARHLVLSATAQAALQDEVIRGFGPDYLKGCILTKTDEAGNLGGILSVLIRNDLPVSYITDGQRIPENLHTPAGLCLVQQAAEYSQHTQGSRMDDVSYGHPDRETPPDRPRLHA